jgi:hypothetical protein
MNFLQYCTLFFKKIVWRGQSEPQGRGEFLTFPYSLFNLILSPVDFCSGTQILTESLIRGSLYCYEF